MSEIPCLLNKERCNICLQPYDARILASPPAQRRRTKKACCLGPSRASAVTCVAYQPVTQIGQVEKDSRLAVDGWYVLSFLDLTKHVHPEVENLERQMF
jgi:hypothetical protein